MQAIRQIIDAEQLSAIVELPAEMRNGEVEIIVMAAPKRSAAAEVFRVRSAEIRADGWEKYIGSLTHADYQELTGILAATERIDANEW